MAGFRNIRALGLAYDEGRTLTSTFRKVPSQASTAGWWVDLSMAAGNPPPNYYASAPLVADVFDDFRGVFHGDNKAPSSKHLRALELITPTAGLVGRYELLDYLLCYPFVDLDDTTTQVMDNTVTLPRYETGAGVRAMLVAVAPTAGGGTFTFDYVNQDGVMKTAPTQSFSVAAANIASIVTSEPATAAGGQVFLQLASGDTGIRSVSNWTTIVSTGGLGSLVLVKPLATLAVREVNTPAEVMWPNMTPGAPRIYDGAYLNLIMNCAASVAAGTLTGRADFTWSSS